MIELIFEGTHPTAASYLIEYAKVNQNSAIVYTAVSPNPTSLPYTVPNLPDGEYACRITPILANGKQGPAKTYTTTGCADLLQFSASLSGENIIVTVAAPIGVAKVNIFMRYPNNGIYNQVHSIGTGTIIIPVPVGVFGDYEIKARTVCNEDEDFNGDFTQIVVVSYNNLNVCPPVGAIVISNITANGVSIIAELPPVQDNVTSYRLELKNLTVDGAAKLIFNNITPSFPSISTLSAATQYSVKIITFCAIAGPQETDGGSFTTTGAANNSSIINNSPTTIEPLVAKINGVVFFSRPSLAGLATTSFVYTGGAAVAATIEITTGGLVADTATLDTALTTGAAGTISGNTITFTPVDIDTTGLTVTINVPA